LPAELPVTNPPGPGQFNPEHGIRGSALIGLTVWDSSHQRLGVIRDIVLDSSTGQLVYYVLAAEVPNVGSELVVVPYDVMRVNFGGGPTLQPSMVLLIPPALLRTAPRIENGRWDVLRQAEFFAQVRRFYRGAERTAARPERLDHAAPGIERREPGTRGPERLTPAEPGRGPRLGPEPRIHDPRVPEPRFEEPRTHEPRNGEPRSGEPRR
jgi:sporulation protein YlmC with PRC-barrel domain